MVEVSAYLFLVSLAIVSLATPLAIRLGHHWNILDRPGPRKVHTRPVPLTGGWAIFLTITTITWVHLLGALALQDSGLKDLLPDQLAHSLSTAPNLLGKVLLPYVGALCVFLLGTIDDIRHISVRTRLVVQILIAGALVVFGFRPSLGFLPEWLGALIGVLWIVGIMNAFNFLDGLDGLSAGTAFVSTIALSTIMLIGNQPNVSFLLAAVGGTLLGFLRFNYHPARVFLGSSGSLLIGYLMAMATVLLTFTPPGHGSPLAPALIPIFILAIPIYDTTSVVIIRLLMKRSIAIGDQSHFHHRLLKLGFSHRQTVLFIWLVGFAISLSAVRLASATLLQTALILVQITAIFLILILAERAANKARHDTLARRRATKQLHYEEPVGTERQPNALP